ncbi:MAG: T9SS type A sorting domain-containing protein [Saprospiraceae bacterium]|nr:T9SS type A sorting domain-containing protein [Saprospiraceae bacterium]
MKNRTLFCIALFLILYIATPQLHAQVPDRSVISSSYQTKERMGEWVLGETIIADFRGISQELNSGFLVGQLKLMSTSTDRQPAYTLDVFPNPCRDQIHIQKSFPDVVTIELRDLHGRSHIRQKLSSQNSTILISQLPTGPYFLHHHSSSLEGGILLLLKVN